MGAARKAVDMCRALSDVQGRRGLLSAVGWSYFDFNHRVLLRYLNNMHVTGTWFRNEEGSRAMLGDADEPLALKRFSKFKPI